MNVKKVKSFFAIIFRSHKSPEQLEIAARVCYDTKNDKGTCAMTERLYYKDAHMKTFTARVLACTPGKHGYDVVLDRTCFYPEGGGQPGDTGTLSGVSVTDTHERGGEIVHYCSAPLTPGAQVEGQIDWAQRQSLMQLHSGEHILSGLAHKHFGYENVGFHMGAEFVTIDLSGPLEESQLALLEREANEAVWQDLPIEISYPTPEALAALPYRSKKELSGPIRIVTIPGYDICACCGTHVARTGEIGPIRIFSCVKFHDGVRLELLCGSRAYDYVGRLIAENRKNSALLSAKPAETSAAVQHTLDELAAVKLRAGQLEAKLFALRAEALDKAGDALVFEPGLSPDGVRRLADAVMQGRTGRAAVFSGSDERGYAYAIGQEGGDLRALTRELNARLNGRGGGKAGFVQGSVKATRAQIEAFWREQV